MITIKTRTNKKLNTEVDRANQKTTNNRWNGLNNVSESESTCLSPQHIAGNFASESNRKCTFQLDQFYPHAT